MMPATERGRAVVRHFQHLAAELTGFVRQQLVHRGGLDVAGEQHAHAAVLQA